VTGVHTAAEVHTWAAYNGILLALVPYAVFRMRGYSKEQMNLPSPNFTSDLMVIVVCWQLDAFSISCWAGACELEAAPPDFYKHDRFIFSSPLLLEPSAPFAPTESCFELLD
jgi:hypothetical protein